jgi:hypothetical protein
MTETEQISETLVFNSTPTRLMARKDFSTFITRQNFEPYVIIQFLAYFPYFEKSK